MAPFLFLFLFLSLSSLSLSTPTTNDTAALSLFRSQTDTHGNLLSNWTSSGAGATACSAAWRGVRCANGRVTELYLSSLDLRGTIDSLSSLDQLRVLDLHDNRLNGTVDAVAGCRNLKLVYLSGNDFAGEIPPAIGSLTRLLRLDLSNNNLNGPIPDQISNLTRLLTLRLQNNEISGEITEKTLESLLPRLRELNLSNNELYGQIPETLLRKFGNRSFSGNKGLCGSGCSVQSNPITLKNQTRKGLSPGSIVAIVVANSVIFLVIASFGVAYYCGKHSREAKLKTGGEIKVAGNNGGGAGDCDGGGTTSSDRSKLVFYYRRKKFELEDLLRASAEMLGKGNLGTVYRAVVDGGFTVAVKRLKDANPCGRREFEQYMDLIGNIKHPNIVGFRAYYYAREEKLLVYDYLPNGSLSSLLHGNRGPGRIPLDWTTRISLVLGAARGLAHIHEEYASSRIPHGNVKSSNILLDKNGVARISDFGLALLLNSVHATARLGGYKAPEQIEVKRLSQKSDVYSFGVLLLEVLTGKDPSPSTHHPRMMSEDEDEEGAVVDLAKWVRSVVRDEWTAEVFDQELLRYKNIEEELVSMLQVGLACVVPQPEKRPTMAQVAKMIEDIRVEQSPIGEDYDSHNSVSPSIATTTTDDAPVVY